MFSLHTLPLPSSGREESAQLCVYVGEEKVVDLWGSPNPSYTADTLATVFSRYLFSDKVVYLTYLLRLDVIHSS